MAIRQTFGFVKLPRLDRALRRAATYAEWQEIAAEHDRLSGAEDWRADDESEWIHAAELRRSIGRLRKLRRDGEASALARAFQDTLFRHQGELTQPELYHVAKAGTKRVITDYLEEMETCFAHLLNLEVPGVDDAFRLERVKRIGRVYGRPALLLSGGALLGLYHFGVIKALFEQDLLPRTLSGSSMGSIMASWACAHTDEELRALFADVSQINLAALSPLTVYRMLERGAVLDQGKLRRFLPTVLGDHTFVETRARSRRILNVTVSPLRKTQTPRLLNYLSAPEVQVNSAVLASCAVPVAFKPVQLMARRRGKLEPWMKNELWIDGSVHGDLPFEALRQMLYINHFITSQANPHVVPLLNLYRARSGLTASLARAGGNLSLYAAAQLLDIARKHAPSRQMREQFNKAYGISSQTYAGADMHIQLPFRPRLYAKLLSNPTLEEFRNYLRIGEQETWPRIPMIRDRTRISRMFGNGIGMLKRRMDAAAAEPERSRRVSRALR